MFSGSVIAGGAGIKAALLAKGKNLEKSLKVLFSNFFLQFGRHFTVKAITDNVCKMHAEFSKPFHVFPALQRIHEIFVSDLKGPHISWHLL